jgi:hypothetical protein
MMPPFIAAAVFFRREAVALRIPPRSAALLVDIIWVPGARIVFAAG